MNHLIFKSLQVYQIINLENFSNKFQLQKYFHVKQKALENNKNQIHKKDKAIEKGKNCNKMYQ